jgi:hypothetical protein
VQKEFSCSIFHRCSKAVQPMLKQHGKCSNDRFWKFLSVRAWKQFSKLRKTPLILLSGSECQGRKSFQRWAHQQNRAWWESRGFKPLPGEQQSIYHTNTGQRSMIVDGCTFPSSVLDLSEISYSRWSTIKYNQHQQVRTATFYLLLFAIWAVKIIFKTKMLQQNSMNSF